MANIVVLAMLSAPLVAGQASEAKPSQDQQTGQGSANAGDSWTKVLGDRSERGTLHDAAQYVRGDTGRWSDDAQMHHLPPFQHKPAGISLDDCFDQWLEKKPQLTSDDDNWLGFRTRQLDDNDRVWIERIERRGNRFTVVANEAIWQGRYNKTFTYYHVFGVNLGKLPPGKYEAKWIVQPLVFSKLDGPPREKVTWPLDERSADRKPTERSLSFTIVVSPKSTSKPTSSTGAR